MRGSTLPFSAIFPVKLSQIHKEMLQNAKMPQSWPRSGLPLNDMHLSSIWYTMDTVSHTLTHHTQSNCERQAPHHVSVCSPSYPAKRGEVTVRHTTRAVFRSMSLKAVRKISPSSPATGDAARSKQSFTRNHTPCNSTTAGSTYVRLAIQRA